MRPLLFGLTLLLVTLPMLGKAPVGVPFVHQEKNGCGAASVAMVMQYWTAKHPELELSTPDPGLVYSTLYRPEFRSITLSSMSQFLEDHGYAAFTFRGETLDLETQVHKGRPVIVAMRVRSKANLHFAVLADLDSAWVWLNDPTRRKATRMKRAKFEKAWRRADNWLLLAAPTRPE